MPGAIFRPLTGSEDFRRERVVVAHDRREVCAERDHAGAGQRGDVEYDGGLEAACVLERVAKDQPPLGIGVDYLDGPAGHAAHDVPRLGCVPARHVLAGGHDPYQVERQSDDRGGPDRAKDACRTGHVELHLVHAGWLLERYAAAVEGNALAHEHDRRRAAAPALMAQYDQSGRLVGSCRHRQERSHPQALQLPFVERAGADGTMLARKLPRARGKIAGRADVGGQVGEVARERGARGDSRAVRETAIGVRDLAAILHGDREGCERRRLRRTRAADGGHAVERVTHRLRRETPTIVRIGRAHGFERQETYRVPRAAAHQRRGCGQHRLLVLLARERALLAADAHHQHALAGAAVDVEQRGLADPTPEIAALRKPRKPAVKARIERYRGCGESAVVMDADDGTIGATACGCAADRMETHLPYLLQRVVIRPGGLRGWFARRRARYTWAAAPDCWSGRMQTAKSTVS